MNAPSRGGRATIDRAETTPGTAAGLSGANDRAAPAREEVPCGEETEDTLENPAQADLDSTPSHERATHNIRLSETNSRAHVVTKSNTSTYEYLLANYGPLLTLKHVAEVMHTTPAGLRVSLSRRRQPMAAQLARTRRRLGRRMYFEARCVADLIDGQPEMTGDGNDPAARRSIPPLRALI